jgi:hypothetical protein
MCRVREQAKADLKRCLELAPDDKAVPKLMTRVEAQIARQKAKEKKMYGWCASAATHDTQAAEPGC